MRVFVASWPTHAVADALSALRPVSDPREVRWVPAEDRHVTLAFLGSVPDDEIDDLVGTLRSVGQVVVPTRAVVGPATSVLGRQALCVPVSGLDPLAAAVAEVTGPFDRSPDRGRRFFGHLTLARLGRRRSFPAGLVGIPVAATWLVGDIRLVSSRNLPGGSEYSPLAVVPLEG